MSTANRELEKLSTVIQSIAKKNSNIIFLNMHDVFKNKLEAVTSSEYINTKVIRIIIDTLFYKSSFKVNQLSKRRGLHFTLDGVHLNSKGASIVADEYASIIEYIFNYKEVKESGF